MNRYEKGLSLLKEIDGQHGEEVISNLKEISPDIANYIVEFAFGDIYSRDSLDLRQKQLVTISSLLSQGGCEDQLYVHLNASLNVGLTVEEILGAIIHCVPYTGFPRVLNAIKVVRKVFEERNVNSQENPRKKTYVLVSMTHNPEEKDALENYKEVAKKVRDENGAKVVFKHDIEENLIGNSEGKSVRILEFPTEQHVHNWLSDPRYSAVKPLRDKAFTYLSLSILKDKSEKADYAIQKA